MGARARTGRFRRSDRILDSRDFRRVVRYGRRRTNEDLVVVTWVRSRSGAQSGREIEKCRQDEDLVRARQGSAARLGITASRKVGNAVRRNRFKRRVREWFRRRRGELDPAMDVVVIARRAAAELDSAELDRRLSRLLGLEPEANRVRRGRRPGARGANRRGPSRPGRPAPANSASGGQSGGAGEGAD